MSLTTLPVTEAEWTKIFPKQVTKIYTSSVTFMKQLTVILVSKIVYLKNAFPEDNYTTETFGGLKLRILKKKCLNDGAQYLSTALTQAFEAFDKKYLNKLALCFYDGECKLENLSEYHVFEYSYYTGGVTMNVHTKSRKNIERTMKCTFDDVRKRTIEIIQTYLVMLQACQQESLPYYDFSIRLYYNEDAPENYQAPGYSMSEEELEDHLAPNEHHNNTVGWVETPFHKLVAKSFFKDNVEASREAIATQNLPVMTEEMDISLGTPREPVSAAICRCACNKSDVTEHSRIMGVLTCFYCKTQQHAVCYGLLPEQAPRVQRHCCVTCADAGVGSSSDEERIPTDERLAGLRSWQRESLCMFRRSLVWCCDRGSVSCAVLQELGAAPHNARRLLQRLHTYGVVANGDVDAPQRVDKEKLKQVMGKYFLSTVDDSIVDQLLQEVTSSQESCHDPVGAILSPMEKVTLQNAAYPCEMLEPIRLQHADEDPTLKQYEEALLSSDRNTDEMPLLLEVLKEEKLKKRKRKVDKIEKSTRKTGVQTKRVCFAFN